MGEEKRKYHHGDLRRALIAAAVETIAAEGVDALTLRGVAERVGVTRMAPYRHFDDKDALLASVAEEGFRLLHDALAAAVQEAGPDSRLQLLRMGESYVAYAVAQPSHYRVMFGPCADHMERYPDLARIAGATFAVLEETVRRAQQSGAVVQGSPQRLAATVWSLVHGIAMLTLDRQVPFDSALTTDALRWIGTGILRRADGD